MFELYYLINFTFFLLVNSFLHNDFCDVKSEKRFDCYPEPFGNEEGCHKRGCCWNPSKKSDDMNVPYCYYGEGGFGYEVSNVTDTVTGFELELQLHGPGGPYGNDVKTLKADFRLESNTRVHVKIFDPAVKRYEVPIQTPVVTEKHGNDYEVTYNKYPFAFSVKRKTTGKILFQTRGGGFIFSDQFLQISSILPSHNIYGLGEHVLPFKLSTKWKTLTAFSRDVATPEGGKNLYGVHPFYLNVEDDGNANGVFLLNSNAMDIILQPTPAITYRTIGGILDVYIFTGPTPSAVVAEYNDVIGFPTMPPYWSLGFHLCRWGYNTTEKMRKVRERMESNKIPQDTQWNDIDYMKDHKDFTIDNKRFHGLADFVNELHGKGMHYIMMLDPAISKTEGYKPYDDGIKEDIFIKDSEGDVLVGQVWPGETVYPDFFNPKTKDYWVSHIKEFYETQAKFDGLWIDMNEPSNFIQGSTKGCTDNKWDNPPYLPKVIGNKLADKTICMDAKQNLERHYDLHSLYGHSEAKVTKSALDKLLGKRSLIVTRSSFPGTGKYAAHWLGDNHSTWKDLYNSISGILNFNLFGIPMVGADICGFMGNTNEELCSRWMQLGAFYPFSRNHNSVENIAQDPAAFGNQLIVASREALKTRYTLLPYLYTLFFLAQTAGETVARPLFFEFIADKETYSIDRQFLWGSALLISPVLTKGATSVRAYLPKGRWYDYYTGKGVESAGEYLNLPASFERVNLHVRGGKIIPTQDPALNTTISRQNDFGLIVALDENGDANGYLFLDDGESFIQKESFSFFKFVAQKNQLKSIFIVSDYVPKHHVLSHITLYGIQYEPEQVRANGTPIHYRYDTSYKVLTVTGLKLSIVENFLFEWTD